MRNLEITECYSRLAAAMAASAGGVGANWCTYATWASRQAGSDDPRRGSRSTISSAACTRALAAAPDPRRCGVGSCAAASSTASTRLGRLVSEIHTPFDAVELASDAVARGNLKVFAEIGLRVRALSRAHVPFEQFLEGLRPGDPPDGQRYLRHAFTRYERQRTERDPKAHARARPARESPDRPARADAAPGTDRRGTQRSARDPGGARAARDRRGLSLRATLVAVRAAPGSRASESSRALWNAPRRGSPARSSPSRSWCSRYPDGCWRSGEPPRRVPRAAPRSREPRPDRAARAVRAGAARAGRLRRARLVEPRPADALHLAPVPRLPSRSGTRGPPFTPEQVASFERDVLPGGNL